MSQPEVVAKLRIDDSEAKKDVESFNASLGKMGVAASAMVAASIAAIGYALKKSVDAAEESEIAVKAFNQALLVTGQYTAEASKGFQDFALGLQRTTGVSDELILKNSALLVSVGKLSGEGLKTATKAAIDLAAGLQIDVGQAFDVVTKAANGNVGMLSKYGLEVNKSATDSQKFSQALEFINRSFGGAGASNLQGYTGAITGMSNAFGDIFEETGKFFTQSKTLRAIILLVSDAFIKVSDSIAEVGSSGDMLEGVFNTMISFGQTVIDLVLKPIEAIGSFLGTGIATIIAGVMTAISPLASIVDKIFKTDIASSLDVLKTNWQLTMVGMAEETNKNAASISDGLITSLDTFQTTVKEKAATISDEVAQIPGKLEESKASQESFFEGFKQGIIELGKSVQNLGKQVASTFVSGFANSFAAMGKALVNGQNAFGEFGKAILVMLGNVAVQMGQFYIAAGIAAMFLNPGSGLGMIAGGIGLSILGGVLMALGGSGGSTGATASGAGSAATLSSDVNPAGSDMALATEEERVRPTSGVTVNVQGNVLDRRQTGLELAQIINESFDTDGVTTRAVSGVV